MINFDNIKVVEKKDLFKIKHIAQETWLDTYANILKQEQIVYMLDKMYSITSLESQFNNGTEFFIYNKNNYDLGFIAVEKHYNGCQFLRIHKLYVSPLAQGKGVGLNLIQFSEHLCLEYKLGALHLNVNRFNRSVTFYKKMNFKIIGREDIDIGNNFFMNDFVMVKGVTIC